MGRGDRRTRRGKIWRGSTGKTRPKKKKKYKAKRKAARAKSQ
jgi:30S ribosomal protein S31